MENQENIKDVVKHKYAEIANQSKAENESSCCGATFCADEVYSIMTDDYKNIPGYQPDADLGLGCGLPTEYAKIKSGDTVVDLGSGAGNDCFIAQRQTGLTGKVIGIDMTPAMIDRARINAEKLQMNNIEFRLGEIENLPLSSEVADVVVSNCVLNLVPDKAKAYAEVFRILKNGGHFSISDVVITGKLPESMIQVAEFYSGCISGATQKIEYLDIIEKAGFKNITVQKEKLISIPDSILEKYLSADDIKEYKNSDAGIYSVTVYGERNCYDNTTCCQ